MKTITAEKITQTVAALCQEACCHLEPDVKGRLTSALKTEESPVGADILEKIIENAEIAERENMPICQDTGMAVFFVSVGQEVYVEGGLTDAINQGVKKGYAEGFLRKSVVADPLRRVNTADNTPAVIHYDIVPGDALSITLPPKGFGSEKHEPAGHAKALRREEGVKNFIVETVSLAGANPRPALVVGRGHWRHHGAGGQSFRKRR